MKSIVLIGDIHGMFFRFIDSCQRFQHQNTYLIHVGDFGVGFKGFKYDAPLNALSKYLVENNNILFVVRGNHDNPSWFKNPTNLWQNIVFLPDYSELNLLDKKILTVGGAVSVDRNIRTEGNDYWKDEIFHFDPHFKYQTYDLVVTHSRTSYADVFKNYDNISHYLAEDDKLLEDLMFETKQLDALYEVTKPKTWVFGHFHYSSSTHYEQTHFKGLDIDEQYQYV